MPRRFEEEGGWAVHTRRTGAARGRAEGADVFQSSKIKKT